jgi:hypothetical protein
MQRLLLVADTGIPDLIMRNLLFYDSLTKAFCYSFTC